MAARGSRRTCTCDEGVVFLTSWTETNPGRRFFKCRRKYMDSSGGCMYFEWYEPPIEDRAKQVINSLRKKLEKIEREKREATTSKELSDSATSLSSDARNGRRYKEDDRKNDASSRFLYFVIGISFVILGFFMGRVTF